MSSRRISLVAALALAWTATPALAAPQDDLVAAVQRANHDQHSGWIVERLMTLKLPAKCLAKLVDPKQRGLGLLASDARAIQRYAKQVTGDDWAAIEGQSANTPEANRATVDKLVEEFKPKFHVTLTLDGDDCGGTGSDLWHKYLGSALDAARKYPPRSGLAQLVIDVRGKTKAISVEVDKAGASFKITAPRDVEQSGWSGQIENAFARVSSNK